MNTNNTDPDHTNKNIDGNSTSNGNIASDSQVGGGGHHNREQQQQPPPSSHQRSLFGRGPPIPASFLPSLCPTSVSSSSEGSEASAAEVVSSDPFASLFFETATENAAGAASNSTGQQYYHDVIKILDEAMEVLDRDDYFHHLHLNRTLPSLPPSSSSLAFPFDGPTRRKQ